jgi:hypothetical protein
MSSVGTSLVAFLIAVSFSAGLNLYATIACLGLLSRAGWLDLPSELQLIASAWIIVPAVALFIVEVFADRLPFVGLAWNVGHLFLRPPVAALLAFQATVQLPLGWQLGVAVLSALIAVIAHSSKTATRVLAAEGGAYVPSFVMNGSGNALAVAIVCAGARHPVLIAAVVLCLLVITVVFIRWTCRTVLNEASSLRARCFAWWEKRNALPVRR